MNLLNALKGLFRSTSSVSLRSGEMTERTAHGVVPANVQSILKDVCIAIMNNQAASSSPLSREELEALLTQVSLAVTRAVSQTMTETTTQSEIQTRLQSENPSPIKPTGKEAAPKAAPQPAIAASSARVKASLSRLTDFLRAHYAFRYNILTRQSEMRALDAPTADYVVVTKREENTLVLEAQAEGIDCWDADVKRFINSSQTVAYHPMIQYFDSLPQWDGVDRVAAFARRISDNKVWTAFGCHRWLLAAVAQWMHRGGETDRANCVAPLLISEQQGLGKSTACRLILPPALQRYYTENFDLSNPSSCEAKLADNALINLDEFDKYASKKMPALKNLMQQKVLSVKRAYASTSTPLHRIASFIGTSNRRDLLVDRTGSRRFICLEVNETIDCETPVEYDQLYAQLKEELLAGARTYFNKEEEAQIQENNRPYYRSSVEEEAFHRHFRFADKEEDGAVFMNATDIFKALKKEEGSVLRGVTAHAFCRLLPTMGKRVHTKWGNGYYVVRK